MQRRNFREGCNVLSVTKGVSIRIVGRNLDLQIIVINECITECIRRIDCDFTSIWIDRKRTVDIPASWDWIIPSNDCVTHPLLWLTRVKPGAGDTNRTT